MNDEIILILETLLALGIAALCICLSKYRFNNQNFSYFYCSLYLYSIIYCTTYNAL